MKDIIIIGGGCAGLTAALYAARAGKTVMLFEAENIGGQITAAPHIDNFPGAPHISGMQFANNLFEQVTELGVEVELDRVLSISNHPDHKTVVTEYGNYDCRAIILATGAKHRKLGLPREKDWVGRGISYCAVCDGAFYKGACVAVVGGGNTALGDAMFLSSLCERVTVIHRRDTFRADAATLAHAREVPNIRFMTGCVVEGLSGEDQLSGILVRNLSDDSLTEISVEALFVAVGLDPDTSAFSGLVDTDSNGYFVSGEDCKTNVSGIYSAGDCRLKNVRQLTTAISDGTNAAASAWISLE